MYNNKLIASIKVNGKILKEFKDTVFLPFGSEYSIYFKNLNDVRAKISISIDGTDALGGLDLILGPGETLDLERFIEDRNFNKGYKFKFIEKTSEISEFRGDRIDDGIIQIKYSFERKTVKYVRPNNAWPTPLSPHPWHDTPWYDGKNPWDDSMKISYSRGTPQHILRSCGGGETTTSSGNYSANLPSSQDYTLETHSYYVNDSGITTKGDISNQTFTVTYGFNSDGETHSIVFNLKGESGDIKIEEILTKKTKKKCDVCGKVSSVGDNFCSRCGTNLQKL